MPYGKSKKGNKNLIYEFGEILEQLKKFPWAWFFNNFLPVLPGFPGKSDSSEKRPFPSFPSFPLFPNLPWSKSTEDDKPAAVGLSSLQIQVSFLIFLILILLVLGINQ